MATLAFCWHGYKQEFVLLCTLVSQFVFNVCLLNQMLEFNNG